VVARGQGRLPSEMSKGEIVTKSWVNCATRHRNETDLAGSRGTVDPWSARLQIVLNTYHPGMEGG